MNSLFLVNVYELLMLPSHYACQNVMGTEGIVELDP
jgi:hypothetical protein